jgi:hypothetical protein
LKEIAYRYIASPDPPTPRPRAIKRKHLTGDSCSGDDFELPVTLQLNAVLRTFLNRSREPFRKTLITKMAYLFYAKRCVFEQCGAETNIRGISSVPLAQRLLKGCISEEESNLNLSNY